VLVGWLQGEVGIPPLAEVAEKRRTLDPTLFELARILAR
jgi:hypothetical protein